MNLDGIEAALNYRLAYVKLGHGSFFQGMPALALQPRRLIEHQAGSFEPHFHVGNLVGDSGKFSDGLAKLMALAGILNRSFQLPLHHAQMTRQNADALPLHGSGEAGLPAPFLAENILNWNFAILNRD